MPKENQPYRKTEKRVGGQIHPASRRYTFGFYSFSVFRRF
jgi:hypothetical protein